MKEALKLALAYVQQSGFQVGVNEVVTAIKEALAQPEQEPVAWYIREKDAATTDGCWAEKNLDICEPLYTTPPQRKPLTREVIDRDFYGRVDFVRQVEAAHGIKE